MPNTTPIQGQDTLDQGRIRMNDHFAATDPHDQYHTNARGDARYVNEVDHTKAAHDTLGIDAGSVGGQTLANLDTRFVNETDHTKAAHDLLDIDADTLDGINSTGFARVGIVNGRDANLVTALVATDLPTQRFTVALTANRTLALPTTGNYNGLRFRVVRTDTAAFTLDVGGLRVIPASTPAWVDVEYGTTQWHLTGYGTL